MRRIVRTGSLLLLILFGLNITALGAARLIYRDPLAPYAAIMPGQPIDAVKDFPCQMHIETDNVESGYCVFDVEDGVFERVQIRESNYVITHLTLIAQYNRLHLGDLLLCWGKPIYAGSASPDGVPFYDLYWVNQATAHGISPYYSAVDYLLPIPSLSIESEWLPIKRESLLCTSEQ